MAAAGHAAHADRRATTMGFRVEQVVPGAEPTLGIVGWDYADCFEVRLDSPDGHPANMWLRTAIAQAGAPVRRLIRLVHRHVVRFQLDPTDRDGFLGWNQLISTPDLAAVEANGTLIRAVIVARRHEPTRYTTSTYLFFHRRTAARLMWLTVRPVHTQVERRLVAMAARALTGEHAQLSGCR
jgi:hypothetical protein